MKIKQRYSNKSKKWQRLNTLRLKTINARRILNLKKHLKNGGKCCVDLGCGDGEFSTKFSNKTKTWVIGIERRPITLYKSEHFNLNDYKKVERFLYIPCDYTAVSALLKKSYRWLTKKAEKTFMIMPSNGLNSYIDNICKEVINLWLKLSTPEGELHIRTHDDYFFKSMKIRKPYKIIHFNKEATDIGSPHTRLASGNNWKLYTRGIKLLRNRKTKKK